MKLHDIDVSYLGYTDTRHFLPITQIRTITIVKVVAQRLLVSFLHTPGRELGLAALQRGPAMTVATRRNRTVTTTTTYKSRLPSFERRC